MIDIHTHIGKIRYREPYLTAGKLVRWMDRKGIEKAVVLAIENPEELDYYVPSPYVLKSCRRYPDRLIPFCNVDPRIRNSSPDTDFRSIIGEYVEQGAKGFGECLAGLPVDDPRLMAIHKACGELGIPILIHMDYLRNTDKVGLPGLERVIQAAPETTFILHATHWWAEISGDVRDEDRGGYPKRPVTPGGKVDYFFQTYPNIYGDLSAGSGYNALTRDPEFGRQFLERNKDRLLFGTDYLKPRQKTPIIDYLKTVDISEEARQCILHKNAERILNL